MPKTFACSITLVCLFFLSCPVQAEVFRFTGESDMEYTNPANWMPSYPGIIINADDVVIIEHPVLFSGPLLLIHGSLRLEAGGSVSAKESHIRIAGGAGVDIRGALEIASLNSEGTLMVHRWASLIVTDMSLDPGSTSLMMPFSSVNIRDSFLLEGRLDVMGLCEVGGVLDNFGRLIVLSEAQLSVEGGMRLGTDQDILYHPQAMITVGMVAS